MAAGSHPGEPTRERRAAHGSLLAVVLAQRGKDACRAHDAPARTRTFVAQRASRSFPPRGRTTARSFAMRFVTYDLAVDLVRRMREPIDAIRRFDPDLARQASRALASVPLNVAEANGRAGRDRLHLSRVALGSLRELGAALDVATALGWLGEPPLAVERDRLCGLIYGCQRPKRK
jgi:four helix bundle protein